LIYITESVKTEKKKILKKNYMSNLFFVLFFELLIALCLLID